MQKHNTDVKPLLKNTTRFCQPVDRHHGVRVKKHVKKQFRDLVEKKHNSLEKNGSIHKITVSELRIKTSKWVSEAWKEISADRKFLPTLSGKLGCLSRLTAQRMAK